MFEKIINYISQTKLLSANGLEEINRFSKQLLNKTVALENILEKIKTKYEFENLKNVEINKGTIEGKSFYFNRIGFWMESYEFSMSVGIEGDMDNEFLLILNDSEIFISEKRIGDEIETIYDFTFKIFYTWVGFLWQKKKLYECGVPMCIEVNSDTMTYYFNDYLKSYYSDYDEVYPTSRLIGRPFTRDLTIEEIFISTYFFRNLCNQLNLYCEKDNLFLEIKMEKNKYILYKGKQGTKGNLLEDIEFKHTHNYEVKEKSSIYYVVKQFKKLVNDNWEFKLSKGAFFIPSLVTFLNFMLLYR